MGNSIYPVCTTLFKMEGREKLFVLSFFSSSAFCAKKAKILHRRNPYRNLWGSKFSTHEFRSGLSSVLRRFVNTFCSHFLKSKSDALSCRTAMFRSELESPDPCAFNDRWNVEFRPFGADCVSFEVFRCARVRNFECILNQSFAAGLRGACSNLFLKADNFGNINNKCCFQATKSLKCCRLKLCCWESIYPFSRHGHVHWNFSSQNGEPKISKNLRLEPLTLHKFRPAPPRSKSFD